MSSTSSPSPPSSLSPDSVSAILFLSSPPTVSAILSIAATAAVAAAETAMVTTAEDDSRSGVKGGECQLLGEASIFIQAALGGLALLSLVYKRWRERPRRPWKIWFFDVSKQVLGSVLLHIANLLMSMLSSGQFEITPKSNNEAYSANPCSFYLLNLAIDVRLLCPRLHDQLTKSIVDYNRNTHTDNPPPTPHPRIRFNTIRATTRLNTVRKLWAATKSDMVVEAVLYIFPRASRHESLRIFHLPTLPVDRPSRRLGSQMDQRQQNRPSLLCNAVLPRHYERLTVLHHRWLY